MMIAIVALQLPPSYFFFLQSELFIAKTCDIFLLLDMLCGMYTPTSSTCCMILFREPVGCLEYSKICCVCDWTDSEL